MSKVVVFDKAANAWVTIDADDVEGAVASGQYTPAEGETAVRTAEGEIRGRTAADLGVSEAMGEARAESYDAHRAVEHMEEQRRAAFDTMADKALTFAEGAIDAASLGLIHERGEQADIRRDVNSGSALVGQLVGTAATMGVGGSPINIVTKGSGAFGKKVAGALLGEAMSARAVGKVATRAIEEAAIGAGLMGSTAFGHQLGDAIIENKPFAGEAIIHEAGLGTLLGFGAGVLSGGFSVAASRKAIQGQGGFLVAGSTESRALVDEIAGVRGAHRDAAARFKMQADVLDVQVEHGVIPSEMATPYRAAAERAVKAAERLEKFGASAVLDSDPEVFKKFCLAQEEANKAVAEAGEIFRSPPSEAMPQRMAADVRPAGPDLMRKPVTGFKAEGGEWAQDLDRRMAASPELREQYYMKNGRDWEPMGGSGRIEGEGGLGESSERFVDDQAAPTDKTNPGGKRKGAAAPAPAPEAGNAQRVNGGVTGYIERGGEIRSGGPMVDPAVDNALAAIDRPRPKSSTYDSAYDSAPRSGEYTRVEPEGIPTRVAPQFEGGTQVSGKPSGLRPWEPSAPPGKFSYGEYSADTLAGEGQGFRRLEPHYEGDLLNHNAGNRELGLFPDGHMAPSKDIVQNGEAFARFREQALSDTAVPGQMGNLRATAGERPTQVIDRPAPPAGPELVDTAKTYRDAGVARGTPVAQPELDALGNRTYKDPGVPRGEPLPKAARQAQGVEAAAEGEVAGKTGVWGEEAAAGEKTGIHQPPKGSPEFREFQRKAAEDYIEKWYWESKGQGHRISPADEAAARLDIALKKLTEMTGGRLDSAGALEIGEHLGLPRTEDMLVDRLQQVWSLRKAANFAADEARGIKTTLGKSGNSAVDQLMRRYARMKGAAFGAAVAGPFGAAAGWVLAGHLPQMMGFGAKAASSAGRVMKLAVETGESLLRGRRATIAARAVAGNRPYAYDDEGPIQDPIKRIQKIHRLAANPDQIRATVRNQLGDAALSNSVMADHIEDTAVKQVTNLSLRAPAIYFDQLSRAVQPTAGKMRAFHEYENATHDLPGLLGAVARGGVTPVQLSALREQYEQVHGVIAKTLMADPEALAKKPTAEIRAIEQVLGIPLTMSSSDPGHVGRLQASWAAANQPQGGPGQAGTPQAFKITAPAPTPTQGAAAGVAPGNTK